MQRIAKGDKSGPKPPMHTSLFWVPIRNDYRKLEVVDCDPAGGGRNPREEQVLSEDMYRKRVLDLKKKEADLKKRKGAEERAVSKLREEIGRLERGIGRTTSESTRKQKSRQTETKSKKAADGGVKVAKLDAEIAKNLGEQRRAQNSLDQAVARRTKKEDAETKKRRDEEMRHAKALTREAGKKNRLHSATLSNGDLLRLPEKITVLFFAANPLDQTQLRLDEEIREVTKQIRLSEHRDSVDLVPRLAVRTEDLFQALNEHEPNVVHFSGHGSEDSVVFQDPDGYTKAVPKEAISAMIAATRGQIRLIVFNTCYSRSQAEAVASHVGTAIGMNAPIGDEAARLFASQLYSAIGFGRSVRVAFDQAVARLMVEGVSEEKTPELFAAHGVDPDEVVLVRPESF